MTGRAVDAAADYVALQLMRQQTVRDGRPDLPLIELLTGLHWTRVAALWNHRSPDQVAHLRRILNRYTEGV